MASASHIVANQSEESRPDVVSDVSAAPDAAAVARPDAADLERAASVLKKQTAALRALARVVASGGPSAIGKALAKLDAAGTTDVGAFGARVRAWLDDERATRRDRLSRALREGAAAANVELRVVARDPLEVRLPPLGVRIDVEADKSEVVFGGEVVRRCRATADEILSARAGALASLEGKGWEPAPFFDLLRRAWERAASVSDGASDWVEIQDVLPEVALLQQSRRFRQDPAARNFTPYGRAQFAYDLWRLRRERCLAKDGWRLSVGPATGGSTKDKGRVFWLEDDQGRGQYHLALRFVREEGTHG